MKELEANRLKVYYSVKLKDKMIDVNGFGFTVVRLEVFEGKQGYDINVHLSPAVPNISPMPISKFLTYPRMLSYSKQD